MEVIKKVLREGKGNYLNVIQNSIGIFIALFFAVSLIPFVYKDILSLLLLLICVQIIISLFGFRIFNLFLEISLLVLAFLSAGSVLFGDIKILAFMFGIIGIMFKLFALLIALIDLSLFNEFKYYNKVQYFKLNDGIRQNGYTKKANNENKKSKFKSGSDIQDATFKEK